MVDVEAFERAVDITDGELIETCFTSRERVEAGERPDRLAARFAAKEAAAKAMGVGIMRGVAWQDIELLRDDGQPDLVLRGGAAEAARQQGWYAWSVSLSHEEKTAIAMVVALRRDNSKESGAEHE